MDNQSLTESLLRLACNHRWTWSDSTQSLFEQLPRATPEPHPVQIVRALDTEQLTDLANDPELVESVRQADAALSKVLEQCADEPAVAYFSPEFGITELVPQYSGGLGVLSGDHVKAASDLALPLVGVGLFYRNGFFRQSLAKGRQVETLETFRAEDLGGTDTGATVTIPLADREVVARVWRLDVGCIPLLLLDTDVDANGPEDRRITDQLYGGDRRHRLEQEMVLGVGGARALVEVGWAPPVQHLNEGHAGFLILELLDRKIETGLDLAEAIEAVRPGLVFTTHTPVPEGIDRFDHRLIQPYLEPWATRWKLPVAEVLALGADAGKDKAFNMAALCLRSAGRANGVSKLHGEVSRKLFAAIPGGNAIGSVTNGVHARTWVAPRTQQVFDSAMGPTWADGDATAWERIDELDDDTIRTLRRGGATDLRDLVARTTGATLDPDALTIGFARRFATYKRATLLLRHPDRLAALLGDDERPVQFVFAGKAHPADEGGKELLAQIVAHGATDAAHGRFVFVPDYDIGVAAAMYAGCDIWLNTPVRPREASGTSGEKAALNGVLNCSISDGWWDEMADGRNGWTIPASTAVDPDERDEAESAAALDLLAHAIVPEYYADSSSWSSAWLDRIRHGWRTLGPQVTAARMVADYQRDFYEPARLEVLSR